MLSTGPWHCSSTVIRLISCTDGCLSPLRKIDSNIFFCFVVAFHLGQTLLTVAGSTTLADLISLEPEENKQRNCLREKEQTYNITLHYKRFNIGKPLHVSYIFHFRGNTDPSTIQSIKYDQLTHYIRHTECITSLAC